MTDPTNAKGNLKQITNPSVISKKLFVNECKKRLDDNIKSLNENFSKILSLGDFGKDEAVSQEESVYDDNEPGEAADYQAAQTEMCSRAALMAKSTDELMKLTNDIREFLVLHDYNYLSQATSNVEEEEKKDSDTRNAEYDEIRSHLAQGIAEIDKEIMECFGMRR